MQNEKKCFIRTERRSANKNQQASFFSIAERFSYTYTVCFTFRAYPRRDLFTRINII